MCPSSEVYLLEQMHVHLKSADRHTITACSHDFKETGTTVSTSDQLPQHYATSIFMFPLIIKRELLHGQMYSPQFTTVLNQQ
jgi:hypothetical protein